MKTNQNMIRKMGNYDITQRTQDGYFDGNALLRQWNSHVDNAQRKMDEFTESTKTKEFIDALIDEINLGEISPKIDIQVVKKSKVKQEGKAGRPIEQVWMHPYLFVKFAMWINPRFEVKVIKFVYDEMIKYRHEAGDEYRNLGSAIKKIVSNDFMQTAMKKIGEALNHIVFNMHETGLRNKYGDEKKQRELFTLEKKVSDLINEGWIKDYESYGILSLHYCSDKAIKLSNKVVSLPASFCLSNAGVELLFVSNVKKKGVRL
jgi:hypothetical protein